jgi:hypothetical protein
MQEQTDDAPARMYIALSPDHTQLLIGKAPEGVQAIPFRPTFFDTLRSMPDVAKAIKEV